MIWWLNMLFYRLFGRFSKWAEQKTCDEHYMDMMEDDFIDIKNFGNKTDDKERYKMLKKRRNWYIRHGYFDLAEDIDTALWSHNVV